MRAIVTMVLMVAVTVLFVGPVMAQEGNATATPEDPIYTIQIDHATRVVDYEYRDGAFIVMVESDRTRLVTTTDVLGSLGSEGASTVEYRRMTVPSGTTELRIEAGTYRGLAAVTVATSQGAVLLQERRGTVLLGPPYSEGDVQVAGVAGGAAGLGLTLVFALRRISASFKGVGRLL